MSRFSALIMALCVVLTPASAWAQAMPTAALYPLATSDGRAAGVVDTALKVALLASERYRLLEGAPPDDYDIACVRSYFCLKRLAEDQQTDRLLTGVLESDGTTLKVTLVLFDSRQMSTLKAVEARFSAADLGPRLPGVVTELLADEPRYERAARGQAPTPLTAELSDEQALLSDALQQREANAARGRQATGPTLADTSNAMLDDFDASELGPAPRPRFLGSAHLGATRAVGYTLATGGIELGLRLDNQWLTSLSLQQLSGRDSALDINFFLLSAALSGDHLFGRRAVHPLAGVEVRTMMLAPRLTAVGVAARGGAQVDLTRTLSARGVLTAGGLYNGLLPDTLFEMNALQPLVALQVQLVVTLL